MDTAFNNPLDMLKNMDGKVAVVGSMNADFTITADRLPGPGETVNGGDLLMLPGGKSSNQAACASKLGSTVEMLGALGDDSASDFLLDKLGDAGVGTTHILTTEGASGTCVIMVDSTGENSIVYSAGANAKLEPEYINHVSDIIADASVLGLCLESPIETVVEAARVAHEAGVKVLLNNSPFIKELPSELIEYSDILLVNEHEMAQMIGLNEPEDGSWENVDWWGIAAGIKRLGFESAVVTLGSHGSMVVESEDLHRVEPQTLGCVDTTGCGDAFMGTILAGLAAGYTLSDSADLASYVGAYAAAGKGAQSSYGTAQEIVDAFIK